ncbi:MAG TPA: prepilin-type N-terminal cleavage/methylation domain-containing protein [Trueperaceae bacterium]|nr:prepilin-type N-terminal cleavage/methylation domain-containing protein [Trueperaceae bacterium]
MRQAARQGFTIVELLIATAIFLTVLTALGSLFVSSHRASNANRDLVASSAQVLSAIQAIQYDVSMAGYRGVDAGAGDRTVVDPVVVTVDTSGGAAPQVTELTVRYFEDRYVGGGAALTEVTYQVDEQGRLLRGANGDTPVLLATGIESLRLLNYRRTGSNVRAPGDVMPDDLTGLDLQIAYKQGKATIDENFSVRLVNQ